MVELDTGSTITHAGVDLIDEIAAANGMDQTEFGYVNGSSTIVTASKCVVADGSKDVATIRNLTISGNLVTGSTTLSEAELGVLDGVTAGTAAAGKALVAAGSTQNITELHPTTLYLGSGAGTAVTASAAELNILDNATVSVTELNKLTGAGTLVASGTKASHIAAYVITATTTATTEVAVVNDLTALTGKIDLILSALEAFNITATT